MHIYYKDTDLFFSRRRDAVPNMADYRMHTHDRVEIYRFVSGRAVFHVEGSAYELQPGDVLVMKPAESHYVELAENIPYERTVLNFLPEFFSAIDPKLMRAIMDRPAGVGNLYRDSDFPDGSEPYFRTMCSTEGDQRLNLLCGTIQLLHALYGLQGRRREVPETTAAKLVRFVGDHIREELSLEEICKEFYLSKSQLCRIFRKATATTVRQYITVKRLVLARELIDGGMRPTRACLQCGFKDYSVFYRAWVKHYGAPPSNN